MSGEIRLATSHSDFWNGLLPMADSFVRAHNAHPTFFASPIYAMAPPGQRGIVNEAGFFLFKRGIALGNTESFLPNMVTAAFRSAFDRNESLPGSSDPSLDLTLLLGRYEALAIARNLHNYFKLEDSDLLVNPILPGCGWVNDVEADILCGTTLYEVKAGERHFRLADLRQLLTYCALNFSSKKLTIQDVALLNPRSGAIIRVPLDELCRRISGTSSVRVLGEIVSFISEPPSDAYFSYRI